MPYDLINHLRDQRDWSKTTFGPGPRVEGVLDHMEKEIAEVRDNPADLEEWIDLAMLAFDGAWRSGANPKQIAECFGRKLLKNKLRKWPDWRESDPNKAIEHEKEKFSPPVQVIHHPEPDYKNELMIMPDWIRNYYFTGHPMYVGNPKWIGTPYEARTKVSAEKRLKELENSDKVYKHRIYVIIYFNELKP